MRDSLRIKWARTKIQTQMLVENKNTEEGGEENIGVGKGGRVSDCGGGEKMQGGEYTEREVGEEEGE